MPNGLGVPAGISNGDEQSLMDYGASSGRGRILGLALAGARGHDRPTTCRSRRSFTLSLPLGSFDVTVDVSGRYRHLERGG